ncbi:hypothetical protein HF086_009507 [Spodoptera exigua]|uniref:Uncharacterized protein n=1 Tax=Spodoptera exigua TaxID=7107 RepID=A0A922MF49_SPOEX|nr:hypothetical protein HF086_009507 [Spodoptera exigua]
MSGDVMVDAPRKHNVSKMRVHDYLYDSAFIVSGARDYARTSFKAAMASAQLVMYYPNCRLPTHIDRSYSAYLKRVKEGNSLPTPEFCGKDSYKYTAVMRHARAWMELVECGQFPSWIKNRDTIISDVVMKDWLFRQGVSI